MQVVAYVCDRSFVGAASFLSSFSKASARSFSYINILLMPASVRVPLVTCWRPMPAVPGSIPADDGFRLPPFSKRSESRDGYRSATKMPAVKFSWYFIFLWRSCSNASRSLIISDVAMFLRSHSL